MQHHIRTGCKPLRADLAAVLVMALALGQAAQPAAAQIAPPNTTQAQDMRPPEAPGDSGVTALAAPVQSAALARLDWGVFCALQSMDRLPAPGTLSGWIHVARDDMGFHWPGLRRLPADLGLAFGVKALSPPGTGIVQAQIRLYRPGHPAPEIWHSEIGEFSPSMVFFRFDEAAEQRPGIWRFEAWSDDALLYRVDFEVLAARDSTAVSGSCGAAS